MNPANKWKPEWEDALRELQAAGKTRAQISVALTIRFARPFTFDAVKSKIVALNRVCLCLPPKRDKRKGRSNHSPASRNSPLRPIEHQEAPMLPEIAPELLQAARVAVADPFEADDPTLPGKRFIDLLPGECKWELIGGRAANFRFCAHNVVPGKSYCWNHTIIAYQPYVRKEK